MVARLGELRLPMLWLAVLTSQATGLMNTKLMASWTTAATPLLPWAVTETVVVVAPGVTTVPVIRPEVGLIDIPTGRFEAAYDTEQGSGTMLELFWVYD